MKRMGSYTYWLGRIAVDTSTLSVGFMVFATDTFRNVLWAKVFNDTVYLAD